jgi:hypothetical protein
MRLILDTSAVSFQVTMGAEARKDFGKDVQKVDRDTGRPQWVVEVLAQDNERGEVIRVTVTGDQPKVNPGQQVRFDALEAIRLEQQRQGRRGLPCRRDPRCPAVPRRLVLALPAAIPREQGPPTSRELSCA